MRGQVRAEMLADFQRRKSFFLIFISKIKKHSKVLLVLHLKCPAFLRRTNLTLSVVRHFDKPNSEISKSYSAIAFF